MVFVPVLQFGKSISFVCFRCWHKMPEEILVLMLDLSLQLSTVGQSIWTVKMACLLHKLRRYISDFKGLARMELEGNEHYGCKS